MGEIEIFTHYAPFNLKEQREIFISLSFNIIPLHLVFLSFKVKIAEITRAEWLLMKLSSDFILFKWCLNQNKII